MKYGDVISHIIRSNAGNKQYFWTFYSTKNCMYSILCTFQVPRFYFQLLFEHVFWIFMYSFLFFRHFSDLRTKIETRRIFSSKMYPVFIIMANDICWVDVILWKIKKNNNKVTLRTLEVNSCGQKVKRRACFQIFNTQPKI